MVRMMEMIVRERTFAAQAGAGRVERLARDPQMQSRLASRIQSKLEVLERRLINLGAIEGAVSSTMMPRRKPATRAA